MLSIFLAKVLGVYIIVVCLAILVRKREISASIDKFENNPLLTYFSGAMILILGLVLVNLHNVWEINYKGIITLIGWLTILKGVGRLFFGEKVINVGKSVFRSKCYTPIIILFLIIGLWFTVVGFGLF